MRRFALYAILQCCGILAFSQSVTNISPASQGSANNSSALYLIDLGGPQTGQITPSSEFWKMDCCDLNAAQSQQSTHRAASQPFHVPPVQTSALLAILTSPSILPSSSPSRIWPNAKSEPIPTQWPNAKFEQIPTVWPHLKMLPLASSVPSK